MTPLEHERAMGFPEGYTDILVGGKRAADQPRSAALRNSWSVPCAAWVGSRIATNDNTQMQEAA